MRRTPHLLKPCYDGLLVHDRLLESGEVVLPDVLIDQELALQQPTSH